MLLPNNSDVASEPASSPSPPSSLTHVHRCIGSRNPIRHSVPNFARLTYLSVYDSRDGAPEPVPYQCVSVLLHGLYVFAPTVGLMETSYDRGEIITVNKQSGHHHVTVNKQSDHRHITDSPIIIGVVVSHKQWSCHVVYYQTIKRESNRKLVYECRCDEKLKPKTDGSTRLGYIGLCGGLEHRS